MAIRHSPLSSFSPLLIACRSTKDAVMKPLSRLLAASLWSLAVWAGIAGPATVAAQENPLREPAPIKTVSSSVSDATSEAASAAVTDAVFFIEEEEPETVVKVQPAQFSRTVPIHSEAMGGSVPIELGPGEFIVEEGSKTGQLLFEGGGGGDCCGGQGCQQCCLIPCPRLSLDNFEFSAGVHGFTGPKNRGNSGSFGFHTGFNWGAPVPCSNGCFGAQIGLNATFSNFSGAAFTDTDRQQLFVTGGLFRRVDWGLQGGLVIDYLSDRWYTDTDLAQVRGEASWVFPCTHELGVWFATDIQDDTQLSIFSGTTPSVSETWASTDLYAFFYRHRFAGDLGASARFFAGFSGDSDGLIGGDLRIPLSCDWALETGFAYLIPEEATTGAVGGGHEHESWNVAMTLVWYPGCRSAFGTDYYRPLFNVANNGSFMVSRQ